MTSELPSLPSMVPDPTHGEDSFSYNVCDLSLFQCFSRVVLSLTVRYMFYTLTFPRSAILLSLTLILSNQRPFQPLTRDLNSFLHSAHAHTAPRASTGYPSDPHSDATARQPSISQLDFGPILHAHVDVDTSFSPSLQQSVYHPRGRFRGRRLDLNKPNPVRSLGARSSELGRDACPTIPTRGQLRDPCNPSRSDYGGGARGLIS